MSLGPLSGVRILELCTTFTGPYSTMLLAQWGAEVIKVEAPSGDVVRYIGDLRDRGMGPVFLNVNQGKRSIVLNLKTESGAAALDSLLSASDVFVHNMRPSAASRLGIDRASVLTVNPSIVYCAIRGYAEGGRYSDRPAYDDVIQAGSGMASVQGGLAQPEYVRHAAADKTVGLMAAASILAALYGRARTGVGQAIEVPMFETMVNFMLLEQQGGLVFQPPQGPPGYPRTESPHRRPCRTKDGYLSVMIYTDEQWRSFFAAIGESNLSDDPRYRTIKERTLHIDELYALVNQHMSKRSTVEWAEILDQYGIPSGPVNTLQDLFDDPQLNDSQFFQKVQHPSEGMLNLAQHPVVIGDPVPIRPAPRLGEHTVEISREIGLSSSEINKLLLDADPQGG